MSFIGFGMNILVNLGVIPKLDFLQGNCLIFLGFFVKMK
jgi:hypothetical protein